MRERRLLCRPRRRYRTTTDSTHNEPRFPNLLPYVAPTKPDQIWQADPTYVRVQQGFVYLACVLDSFTREIVGWSMSRFMDAALPLAALNNALAARCPAAGLLHHSDQGVQYASRVYVDLLSLGVGHLERSKFQGRGAAPVKSRTRLNRWQHVSSSYCFCVTCGSSKP